MARYDLGFLGGGQLARMSIQAAQRMGLSCISLEAGENTPASQVAPAITGALNHAEALAELIRVSDKITLENEFIPANALRAAFDLAGRNPADVIPGISTLETIQDKLKQRQAYLAAGVPSPRAIAFDDPALAIEQIGLPLVLKARFGGYDGKGTRVIRTPEELEACRGLENWLAEEFVPFKREVAVMVARTPDQSSRMQLIETIQPAYVCDHTIPAHWGGEPTGIANISERAVAALGGFGLFGVEMFETEDGRILVNEIAPRPHNTGHYSMDWGAISQFEWHVRAVLGLTLPQTNQGTDTIMLNLLGREGDFNLDRARKRVLSENPDARFHWYGKAEMRPGRKLGHINLPNAKPGDLSAALNLREVFFRS